MLTLLLTFTVGEISFSAAHYLVRGAPEVIDAFAGLQVEQWCSVDVLFSGYLVYDIFNCMSSKIGRLVCDIGVSLDNVIQDVQHSGF